MEIKAIGCEPLQLRQVLAKDGHTLKVYRDMGGYTSLKKALGMAPADIIEAVKTSALRGRGGAGFPTGMKWSFVPKDSPKPKYLVCNADESEPGTFKDRYLLERDPHALIEGMVIAGRALGAATGYIYYRGEYRYLMDIMDIALAEARDAGLLGRNILGSGFDMDIFTHTGAGAYICGEETSLLSSLEGFRGHPRMKPPFPALEGLYACPTVVNNVETLTNVPWIMVNGAAEYKKIGTEQSTGTKIFCVSGHVPRPGNYELPLGVTFRELLVEHAGCDPANIKGILPSGGSGPVVRGTDEVLDTKLSYEDMVGIGTILGSASVIVMDNTVDMAWAAARATRFFRHESCGKCTPCREGTYWLDKVLDRILAGQAQQSDIDRIDNVAKNMAGITLCAFGDFAANPTIHMVKNFPEDFAAHIQSQVAEEKPARKAPPRRKEAAAEPAGD